MATRHLIVFVALGLACSSLLGAEVEYTLTQGDWTLTVFPAGQIKDLHNRKGDKLTRWSTIGDLSLLLWHEGSSVASQPEGDATHDCSEPASVQRENGALIFDYPKRAGGELNVRYTIILKLLNGHPLLERTVAVTPTQPPFTKDFGVRMGINAHPEASFSVFAPRADGMGDQVTGPLGRTWSYRLGGPVPREADQLAIPMVSLSDGQSKVRVTHIADPYFTTTYRFYNNPNDTSPVRSHLTYVREGKKAPLTEPFTRTFWTVIHDGPPERAMDAWYATALADVPAGPAWLHDVAMQDYDYLSHGGKGWFADIDAAEKLIAPAERGKVLFALHGWYDMLGRYSFDAKTGKLDDEWTAFPNAPAVKKRFPTSESVKMSKAQMHRRIKYAKDRGFRVVIYFADGLTACEGAGVMAEGTLLNWGGWEGPDTVGKPYLQNPAHPAVYKWYVDYLKALLNEYGQEVDGFNWDETFMIRAGATSPPNSLRAAYLAPIFMKLARELTQLTTAYRKDLAFMTSDCQGMAFDEKTRWLDVPPYAIMSHGTYQDSHCSPSAWPYAIFANYRNVLWSCNWQAVTHFDYTKFGVEHYSVPVAVSNGWKDDKGLARLNEAERKAVMDLFNQRKYKPQHLGWLTGPAPVFNAKP